MQAGLNFKLNPTVENSPKLNRTGPVSSPDCIFSSCQVMRLLDQGNPVDNVSHFIMALDELSCQQVLEICTA